MSYECPPAHVGSLHKLTRNLYVEKRASPVENSSMATNVVIKTTSCRYKLQPLDGGIVQIPPPIVLRRAVDFFFFFLFFVLVF